MCLVPFDEFLDSLTDLSSPNLDVPPTLRGEVERVVGRLTALSEITRRTLAEMIRDDPAAVPLLATSVGLTQERLKNQLRHRMGTSGWVNLAKNNANELIRVLDEEFELVRHVHDDFSREWSLADVFSERYRWSKRAAGSAINRGRQVEDEVERVVKSLGLPYEMRAQFEGRRGTVVPCDLAIPSAENPEIVGGAKGFNSTGSKLSDAVREVVEMADCRYARQFVFAFVDGIGWKNRQSDLRRIHKLWADREIDGLYTLSHLDRFREDLIEAAVNRKLRSPE